MKNYTIERKYLSVSEFCQIYGVGRTFAYELMGTEGEPGPLTSIKLGSRRLISVESAEVLVSQGRVRIRAPNQRLKSAGGKFLNVDLQTLSDIVQLTRTVGGWEAMNNYWRYRCDSGAIFNWWPSTGAYNFQGPAVESILFAQQFAYAMCNYHDRSGSAIESKPTLANYHIPTWSDEGES